MITAGVSRLSKDSDRTSTGSTQSTGNWRHCFLLKYFSHRWLKHSTLLNCVKKPFVIIAPQITVITSPQIKRAVQLGGVWYRALFQVTIPLRWWRRRRRRKALWTQNFHTKWLRMAEKETPSTSFPPEQMRLWKHVRTLYIQCICIYYSMWFSSNVKCGWTKPFYFSHLLRSGSIKAGVGDPANDTGGGRAKQTLHRGPSTQDHLSEDPRGEMCTGDGPQRLREE